MITEDKILQAAQAYEGPNGLTIREYEELAFTAGAQWMQKQNDWISIEKQYPELHAWVIVTTPYCAYTACPAKWTGAEWVSCNRAVVMNVSHWMPMCEPPKTESK